MKGQKKKNFDHGFRDQVGPVLQAGPVHQAKAGRANAMREKSEIGATA